MTSISNIWKEFTSILSNLNNFHSLEVVDRVSYWQLGTRIILWNGQPQAPTKWNESGFRPPLCTYRLNWARRTSWGWWDDWDDTVLQTQDSKFEPWRSRVRARYLSVTEAPHNTNFHTWMGKKHFCFFQTAETGDRTPDSGVKGSGANHYPGAPAPTGLHIISRWLFSAFAWHFVFSSNKLYYLIHELSLNNTLIINIRVIMLYCR